MPRIVLLVGVFCLCGDHIDEALHLIRKSMSEPPGNGTFGRGTWKRHYAGQSSSGQSRAAWITRRIDTVSRPACFVMA
jgi:hypothetical protein